MITFTWPRYGENMLIKTGANKFQDRVGKVGKIAQIGTRCCQHLDVRQDNVPWTPSPEEVRSSADRSSFQWEIGNESHAMVARRMWPVLKASLTFVRKASFAQVASVVWFEIWIIFVNVCSDWKNLPICSWLSEVLVRSGWGSATCSFFRWRDFAPRLWSKRPRPAHASTKGVIGCYVGPESFCMFHRAMRTVMRRSFWILGTFAKMFCPKSCQVDELSPKL